MQQALKAMLLGTELYSLERSRRAMSAGTRRYWKSDASWQSRRARAPYEAGGEGVVNTPEGLKEIPLTAASRAAMQPSVQLRGYPAAPRHHRLLLHRRNEASIVGGAERTKQRSERTKAACARKG